MCTSRSALTLICLGLCAVGNAQSGSRITSPAGFSIVPPAGWRRQGDADNAALRKAANEVTKSGSNNIAMVLFEPSGGQFKANINVLITNSAPSGDPSPSDVEKFRTGMQQSFDAANIPAQVVGTSIGEYAGRKVITAETDLTTAFGSIHQLVVAFPGASKGYVVTCSSAKASFDHDRPVFEAAINSMQFAEGPPKAHVPEIVQYAIIGGLVGGFVGLVGRMMRNGADPKRESLTGTSFR